jgi:hypothetical protein
MFRALMLSLFPALILLAFRTLCTLRPAPVPKYLARGHECRWGGSDWKVPGP